MAQQVKAITKPDNVSCPGSSMVRQLPWSAHTSPIQYINVIEIKNYALKISQIVFLLQPLLLTASQ